MLFPAWAKYVCKYNTKRFARFARNVWQVSEADDEKAAYEGIDKMSEYFVSIGMPSKLADFKISSDCVDALADLCTFGKTRTIKSYMDMDYEHIKNIFESCL